MNDGNKLETLLAEKGGVRAPDLLWPAIETRFRRRRQRRRLFTGALAVAAALLLTMVLNRPGSGPALPETAMLEAYMEETLELVLPSAPVSAGPALLNLDTLNAPAGDLDGLSPDMSVALLEI